MFHNNRNLALFFTHLALGFFISPSISAATRHATDELSVSHQYAYRLITRQMSINPVHRFSDNVKPVSFREIAILNSSDTSLPNSSHSNSPYSIFHSKIQEEIHYSQTDQDSHKKKKMLIKPVKELQIHNTFSSKENANIPSNFGERYSGKQLTAFSAYGNFYYDKFFTASHETRVDIDESSRQLSLYKFRLKTASSHYSLSYAKESLVLGPGHFGNLLHSNNIEPEKVAMLKIEDPYKLPYLGYLRFYMWHIAYDDDNRVNKDPNLLGFRLSIKPNRYFETNFTRTTYYGGTNNDTVSGLRDLIKLVTAEDENSETTINTDQLAAIDISIYIPAMSKYSAFKGGKVYTERVWNDIKAIWQKDDRNDGVLFKLLGTSFIHGVFLTTGKFDIHLEYVKTAESIYAHSNFGRDGLTDNGYIIGHFIGRGARAYLSEMYYEFSARFHGFARAGLIKQGVNLDKQNNSIRLGVGLNYFYSTDWQFGFTLNRLTSDKTDIDNSPVYSNFIDKTDEEINGVMKLTYFLE